MLAQDGLLVHRSGFKGVHTAYERDVGMHPGIGQGALLRDALALQVHRPKVGKGIAARVVVVRVLADIRTEVEHGIAA